MHIVAVGGSDAGVSAALRAREVNPGAEFTVVVADAYPNFSICGTGSAVIVGAGYVGLEMAEALTTRGLDVTQLERLPEVLPTAALHVSPMPGGRLPTGGR